MATADDVAAAVIAQVGLLDAMKLEKLVYYSQAWHLAITDAPLFDDPIEAWRDGPVVDHLYQQHRKKRAVAVWPAGEPRAIGDRGRRVIALVCMEYGQKSGEELSRLTHSEEPWRVAWGGRSPFARGRTPISHGSMAKFYRRGRLGGRTAGDLAAGGIALSPPGAVEYSARDLNSKIDELRDEFMRPAEHEPTTSSSTVSANRDDPVVSNSSRVITFRTRTRP
ncbi:type II toxin-antitoxin system antitoxin SocA domain-containing protein [Kribbella sp. HUAS MG21]|uniref:Type II toxin-antitoxin system antitoxin SocA domain-containing protein n=1 Tax=Kribbella sp. HUAS MG21 TaxID=3160966 RepID=A0AAU7TLR8_9ACTN